MAKPSKQPKLISNRKARFDYNLKDTLIVGIQLSGAETKAIRQGHAQLRGSYVNILKGELWLINANISGTNAAPIDEADQYRTRKLLAKSSEINDLSKAKDQGLTIVPLELLTNGKYIKLKIAVGQGKKNYDKRESLKKRDEERKIQRFKYSG
jgi:SsrA-binding protein